MESLVKSTLSLSGIITICFVLTACAGEGTVTYGPHTENTNECTPLEFSSTNTSKTIPTKDGYNVVLVAANGKFSFSCKKSSAFKIEEVMRLKNQFEADAKAAGCTSTLSLTGEDAKDTVLSGQGSYVCDFTSPAQRNNAQRLLNNIRSKY